MKKLSLVLLCSVLCNVSFMQAAADGVLPGRSLLAAGAAGGALAWLANRWSGETSKKQLEAIGNTLNILENQHNQLRTFLVGEGGALAGDPIVNRLAAVGVPEEVVDETARKRVAALNLTQVGITGEEGNTLGECLQEFLNRFDGEVKRLEDLNGRFENYVGVCDANFKRAQAEQEEYETTKEAFTEELRKINQKISALSTSDEVLTGQGLSASALEDLRSLKDMIAKATEISQAFEQDSKKITELEEKVAKQEKLIAMLMAHCNLNQDKADDSQN